MGLFTDDDDEKGTIMVTVDGQNLEIPERSSTEEILTKIGKDPTKYSLAKGDNAGGSNYLPKGSDRIQHEDGQAFFTNLEGKGGI